MPPKTKLAEEERRLRARGIKPCRRWHVYRVTCTKIAIPQWARENLARDFSEGEQFLWMKHRQKATILGRIDRDAGGKGEILKVECRYCLRCGMAYLDAEAGVLRELQQRYPNGRRIACGPQCDENRRRRAK